MHKPQSARPYRILVVDDDTGIRNLVIGFLKMRGHEVEAVSSGEAAVEAAAQSRFHVMVLDSRLPGMSGDEVIERLAKMKPKARPAVILVTGRITARIPIEGSGVNVVDVLRKPFDLQVLDRAVRKALGLPENGG